MNVVVAPLIILSPGLSGLVGNAPLVEIVERVPATGIFAVFMGLREPKPPKSMFIYTEDSLREVVLRVQGLRHSEIAFTPDERGLVIHNRLSIVDEGGYLAWERTEPLVAEAVLASLAIPPDAETRATGSP